MSKVKPIHMLDSRNYYYCIRAVGNGVCGVATKNPKLVTCKNCLAKLKKKCVVGAKKK